MGNIETGKYLYITFFDYGGILSFFKAKITKNHPEGFYYTIKKVYVSINHKHAKENWKGFYNLSNKEQYQQIFFEFELAARETIKNLFKIDSVYLKEALEVRNIKYSGTRKKYKINDPNPNILIIDKNYNVDGKGNSILGINLNYLNKSEKRGLLRDVNKLDNTILNIKGIKAWLRSIFGLGDYDNLTTDVRIKRYKKIIKKFPILKKAIRRYKHDGVKDWKK